MDSKTVTVSLFIDGIDEEYNIDYQGIHIYYKNKYYIVTIYRGLPVKYVKVNNIIITNFIISKWNDLLIIPLNFVHDNIHVFRHFIKKDLDINEKCINNHIKLRFIQNTFNPIHEIPGNPVVMYNVFKKNVSDNLVCGEPIYNQTGGLYGLVTQNISNMVINNMVFVLPSIYILMTLDKQSNNIYVLDENKELITKISNYKTICDKIYCPIHKTYIPIDCYIVFNCDSDTRIKININNIDRYARIIEFKNPSIILSNSIIKTPSTKGIVLTSGLLHLLKELNEFEILSRIMTMGLKNNYISYRNYIITS
jgi:hypothetical protein